MAGVGFVLRRLSRQDSLNSGLRAYGHAAFVACGPWLFTILALATVEVFGSALLSRGELQRFFVIVMYNFAFSLVVAGPLVLVVTRRIADRIYAKDVSEIPGMFIGSLALLFVLHLAAGVPFYGLVAELGEAERLLALLGFLTVGGIWVASTFMSALKSFGSISAAFVAGMATALAAAALLAPDHGVAGMLAGFDLGLALIFFGLAARIFAEYPVPVERPFSFLSGFRHNWEFALVGVLYNAGIWVDKWIMWLSPGRLVIAGAMPVHPAYDGAMFLSYLTIIPAMTMFLVAFETHFFELYLRFYRSIEQHATAAEIQLNHELILRALGRGLRNLFVLQAVVCYVAILVAPALISRVQGGIEMVPIFRFGALGALFHVMLLSTLVVVAYFDLRRVLLAVTAFFFLSNAGLTLAALWLGFGYDGYGYFLSTLATLIFALSLTIPRVLRLPYMTFIANNPGLR
ncbi:hypothetical protein EAH89_09745 [Roseomonas nepalensis]|uniref:Histidine kinase n=1 Tax=Muricoccus nepalensis TaxID=1854500 RepID=A0A502G9K0_9PROT|nr:exopolysaccharide Pel transporter PelG [Roseomonas nepalensis]TPG57706.1 hypothetical protein EAH89_09745 [Roseomonas nepalensis]